MKDLRLLCEMCLKRWTYTRTGKGRTPTYCPECAERRTKFINAEFHKRKRREAKMGAIGSDNGEVAS